VYAHLVSTEMPNSGGLCTTQKSHQGEAAAAPARPQHLTTHLRSSSQEVFDGHEGLFAAKANNGERFFLRLSKYLTSLYGVRVCQQL
jgi:hypothetical protein